MKELDRYRELAAKAEAHKRHRERMAGVLDRLKAQLKEEFGCDSLEEAEQLLKSMQKEITQLHGKMEKLSQEFEAAFEAVADD